MNDLLKSTLPTLLTGLVALAAPFVAQIAARSFISSDRPQVSKAEARIKRLEVVEKTFLVAKVGQDAGHTLDVQNAIAEFRRIEDELADPYHISQRALERWLSEPNFTPATGVPENFTVPARWVRRIKGRLLDRQLLIVMFMVIFVVLLGNMVISLNLAHPPAPLAFLIANLLVFTIFCGAGAVSERLWIKRTTSYIHQALDELRSRNAAP